jgi:hypothetical protein
MLARVCGEAPKLLFCSSRRSASFSRWAGVWAGMDLAQSWDHGVEVKKGERGSWLEV